MERNELDSGRRTALKSIAGLSAGAIGLPGVTVAAARRERNVESVLGERVAVGEAATVAERARERHASRDAFAAWAGAAVGEPTTYGTTVAVNSRRTHEPTAYVFPVERDGEAVGYLTVSARRQWSPVLEASTAAPPAADRGRAAAAARAVDEELTGRLLYDGGVAYGVETTGGRVAHLGTGLVAPTSTAAPRLAVEDRPDAVASQWADATDSGVTDSDLEDIEGVPTWDANGGSGSLSGSDAGGADTEVPELYGDTPDPWDEWDGCSPFAAAQIMMYHEGIGLDEIEAREEMVDRLHVLMGTDENGWTDYLKPREGVTNYPASELDHDYTGHEEVLLSKGLFRNEVGADRPFILNIPSNDGWLKSDSKGPYSGHSVVVTGYYEYDDTFEVIHQNSWDTNEHWMSYGNWPVNTWVTRVVH